MTRPAWLLLTGAAAYLVCLTATVPAQLFLGALDRLPASVSYAGVEGTLWRGQAGAVDIGGVHAGRLRWRVHPPGLVRGRLAMDVTLDGADAMLRGHIDARPGVVTVSELDAVAPAWLLAAIAGVVGPVDAEVTASGLALTLRDGVPTAASGVLRLRDVRFAGADRFMLGDYRLDLRMAGDRIVASLQDESEVLSVTGEIAIDAGGAWEADLRVATREAGRDLRAALAVLGEPDAEGYHRLHVQGTLE